MAIKSGSLPIKAADEAERGLSIYGQEMDKAVKQGMMQELSTGKTRLVKSEARAETTGEKSA